MGLSTSVQIQQFVLLWDLFYCEIYFYCCEMSKSKSTSNLLVLLYWNIPLRNIHYTSSNAMTKINKSIIKFRGIWNCNSYWVPALRGLQAKYDKTLSVNITERRTLWRNPVLTVWQGNTQSSKLMQSTASILQASKQSTRNKRCGLLIWVCR